jgi:hypothetical protein
MGVPEDFAPSAFSLESKNRFFWQDKRNGF